MYIDFVFESGLNEIFVFSYSIHERTKHTNYLEKINNIVCITRNFFSKFHENY